MGLQEALGVDGPGRPVMLDGKEYRICRVTQGMKAEFCEWYIARIKKRVYQSAGEMRKMARDIWEEVTDDQRKIEHMDGSDHKGFMALQSQIKDRSLEARALEEEARAAVEKLNKEIAVGHFEWGAEGINEALNVPTGGYQITLILLREKQPTITHDEVVEFYGQPGKKMTQAKELHDMVQWALYGTEPDEKKSQSPQVDTETPTNPSSAA